MTGAPVDVEPLVDDAYRRLLRREPDADGRANWIGGASLMAHAGRSADEIGEWLESGLRSSTEFEALALVDAAFEALLGRSVEGGRGYWHDEAVRMMRDEDRSAADTEAHVREGIVASDEYQLQHPEELVAALYRELLDREPDADEVETFSALAANLREQGLGLAEVREALAEEIRASAADADGPAAGITVDQLLAVMPDLLPEDAERYLPHLNAAMAEAEINTPQRQAAFLAQLAHESVQLIYFEEIASGEEYEGRTDLGNVEEGDGTRYKGRGPIQLTGRANYRAAGEALGLDLEGEPERAADPDVAFRIAAWYWTSRDLNAFADESDFDAITYRVNGGYNGKESRDAFYERALETLGA